VNDYLVLEISPILGQQPWNSACNVQYQPATNTIYLTLDNGTSWASGTLGSGGVLSNSQCAVNVSGGSASRNGGAVTLTLPITFTAAYSGTKYDYVALYENGFTWFYFGTIVIQTASQPTANLLQPANGTSVNTGQTITYTMYGYEPDNWNSVNDYLILEVSPTYGQQPWNNVCNVQYQPATNTVYLTLDNGASWASGAPGTGGVLSNSQCSVNLSGGTVSRNGGGVTLTLPITFTANYTGTKYNYVALYENGFTWFYFGTITVVNQNPTQYYLTTSVSPVGAGSITPASGLYNSGTVVTVTATAYNGYQFSGFSGALSGTTNPQNLTITGTTSVTANFSATATPDFTLDLPSSVSVGAGFQSSFLMKIVPQGGFNAAVTWAVSPSATGVTAAWAANSQPALAATTGTATLNAQATASPGAYHVIVTATGGGVQHSATIAMTVSLPLRAESETNMGPISFLQYNYSQGLSPYPLLQTTCPNNPDYRACFQQIMGSYQSQQISGVRFMFDLSEALNPDQSVNPAWVSALEAFFGDLHNHGIDRITPNIREWVSDSQYQSPPSGPQPNAGTCLPADFTNYQNYYAAPNITQIRFSRTAPFGEVYICTDWADPQTRTICRAYGWTVDGNGGSPGSTAYYCAMANPYFVGWGRSFDILDALLQAARDNALTVQEFDGINEIQLSSFSVRGRLIVDNSNSDYDVLGEGGTGSRSLRKSMQDHGFDPGRVAYSVIGSNAQEPLGECPANNLPYFGDSGRLADLSMLTATIGVGGPFGNLNWNFDFVYPPPPPPVTVLSGSGLACGGSALGAAYLPLSHTAPTVVDVHSGPCVVIKKTNDDATNATNGWGECDPDQWGNVAGEATQMGNDLAAFLSSFNNGWRGYNANLASALAILGETHGRLKQGDPNLQAARCPLDADAQHTACVMSTTANTALNSRCWAVSTGLSSYNGFSNSNLATWARSNGLPAGIVFRPWEYLVQGDDPQANACNTISTNPPYSPRQ
jgi:hypothetical protein